MAEIGLIGIGNMGLAIGKGLLKSYKKEDIVFTDKSKDLCKKVHTDTGLSYVESNQECAAQAKYIVLAVKPQYLDSVIQEIKDGVTNEHVLISIAPGITTTQLRDKFSKEVRVVRAMPNTPALLGEGMTGVCYDEASFTPDEGRIIEQIFTSLGKMKLVEERLMNGVVCVSGSSPAFVYLFIEALADSGVKYGLPRETAYEMAAQAVYGSAKMVMETGEHPGALKDKVCSPGGTTIAGVAALEEYGFRNAIMKAADACFQKCENL